MNQNVFQTEYAGHTIRYSLVYPGTRYCFHPWLKPADGEKYDIKASLERIERARKVLPEDSRNPFVEFRALIGLTAQELLRYDCCIFHCVSFLWHDKAFLLTAPSGMGKTTQFCNWERLFPGEVTMICGDMPVLERRDDGSVWVHPSSWNGKEHLGTRNCGKVAGIVLLEQGKENEILSLTVRDAVQPFFRQFLVRPETEEQLRSLARIMDQMLRNIPCFRFVNRGDDMSTKLLRKTLAGYLPEGTWKEDETI